MRRRFVPRFGDHLAVAPLRVKLVRSGFEADVEVEGAGVLSHNEEGSGFVATLELVGRGGLSSLRRALCAYADHFMPDPRREGINPRTGETVFIGAPETVEAVVVQLVEAPEDKFAVRHSYEFVPEPVAIVLLHGGALAVRVEFIVVGEDEPDVRVWLRVLAPLLARWRGSIDHFEVHPEGPIDFRASRTVVDPDYWVCTFYVSVPTRGRDVAWAAAAGHDVLAVLEAARDGDFSPQTTQTLIEAGRADLLLGQREEAWLECKGQPYPETDYGRDEFAKDVAAFANSASGGVIVIGLQTTPRGGADVISSVRPCRRDDRVPDRYRKWIDRWLFPRVVGLRIKNVQAGGGNCLILVVIPPQPPALRPFLVKGVLRGGKIGGSYVGIFERRGDATVETGAEEVHALLVAGRAALGYEGVARE